MASMDDGKDVVIYWIKGNFPKGATCLDVGPCDGKWHDLLGDYLTMDAVEIFRPNIENHKLYEKYRNVYNADVADFEYEWYDLIIFGDVIEHMTVEKAQRVLEYAMPRCKDMVVAVPFHFHQDEQYGNPYEVHIQEDLSPENFKERYPDLQLFRRSKRNYAYYTKHKERKKLESSVMFSVICPTHNGADRLPESLSSVTCQTFTNYELIVVCDSCTDDSAEVARKYTDKVVEVDYNRDGLARNAGIDIAQGEWLLFIDDDDCFLHEYCFELLNEEICKTRKDNPDIINYEFIWKHKGYQRQTPDTWHVMVWCRAWRREFVGDNRMDDCPYGADLHFYNYMVHKSPNVTIDYFETPIYYYNYLREGSMVWMDSKKKLLDIVVTHYDEPWEVCKPFFDMIQYQRVADMNKVNIILVQDGKENNLDWKKLLKDYSYSVTTITTASHSGAAAARNAGLNYTQSDWVMFCDIDDMFCDACALSMILSLLPTDKCDIIWGRFAMELLWRKGLPYLQTVNAQNYLNTTCKMYRTQFLRDKHIKFDTSLKYMYEYAFNAVCLNETPPFRIRELTMEFYPYIKLFRKDSLRCTKQYYENIGKTMFITNIHIADELYKRGYTDEACQFYAKALCIAYYSFYDPSNNVDFSVPDHEVHKLLAAHLEKILSVPVTDMDVILDESMGVIMGNIERAHNTFKCEYYLKNDEISFSDWVNSVTVFTKTEDSKPVAAEEAAPVISNPKQHTNIQAYAHDPHVVVYCGTANVYEEMMTSCKSMLCNLPVDKVYFLIEDDEFPYELPDIVETINVSDQQTFPEDGPNYDNAWSYMCMMRALFPDMFSQYNRILSLDIDIIFNDNVSDLWDYDISDYFLAGVPEKQRQKTEDDPMYINFGVVLMNLDKLRKENKSQEIINVLNTNKVDCPEQTAYNEACAYHILELPADYNTTVYSHITGKPDKERVLHYAGQTFWKHYSNVKRFANMSWDDVMTRQNELKGETKQ